MATEPKKETAPDGTRIPPPVPGGTGSHESLGRWIDDLFGDRRQRLATARELAPLFSQETPDDPPPSEPPPPVPGGTQPVTRGGKPGETK
jgi:hypothetical protein